MALPTDILQKINDLEKRIEALERSSQIKDVKIPTGGKLVANSESSDPPVENGKVYYNTTSGKLRKCTGGVWSDVA